MNDNLSAEISKHRFMITIPCRRPTGSKSSAKNHLVAILPMQFSITAHPEANLDGRHAVIEADHRPKRPVIRVNQTKSDL